MLNKLQGIQASDARIVGQGLQIVAGLLAVRTRVKCILEASHTCLSCFCIVPLAALTARFAWMNMPVYLMTQEAAINSNGKYCQDMLLYISGAACSYQKYI